MRALMKNVNQVSNLLAPLAPIVPLAPPKLKWNKLNMFIQIPKYKMKTSEYLFSTYIKHTHKINMIKFLDIAAQNNDLFTNIIQYSNYKNLIFICDDSIIINNYQFNNSEKMYYLLLNKIKELDIICNITKEENDILINYNNTKIIMA